MVQQVADYFSQHGGEYAQMVLEHIEISALAVLAACVIALPLGVLCARWAPLEKVSVGIVSALRIVPSLAILVVCVPFLGTGMKPTIVALVVLAFPPILINTTLAFRTLPADVLEAARGMGMGPVRTFFTIKVPLAFPTAFAGIRTAVTEVIASATLAAYIGAGGLGNIIFTGLGLMRTDLLWIGGLSVAALSLIAGQLLALIDRRVRKYELA